MNPTGHRGALGSAVQRLADGRRYGGARLPPGPLEPALVQTWQWVREPIAYLERARARFGGVFTSRLAAYPPLVHFSDPEAIREIFTGPGDVLHAGEANAVLRPILGASSLLLLDGEPHLRHRRLLLPPFHGQRLHAYSGVMREITERAVAGWPRGKAFAVHARTQAIALDVILETVFGLHEGEVKGLRDEIAELFESTSHNPIFFLPIAQIDLGEKTSWGRFRARLRSIDARIFELIAARRAEAARPGRREREDVLALLIEARDEDGAEMSAQELRDELMTLLVAGHDTVATALAWTFHHLVENRGALERAYREVDRAGSDAGAGGDSGDGSGGGVGAAELPWIDAVVKESLRLTPVLPIVARRLQADMTIGGIELPRGVRAAPNVYLAHRDPAHWKEPERFLPERFLEARPGPYVFFPFGGGIRRCIGMAFALHEMRVVLATVLRRVWLERAPGTTVRAVRRGVALGPSEGMPLVVRGR